MIVLCGIPSEAPLCAVIDAAERLGVDHVVFNQRQSQYCDMGLRSNGQHCGGSLLVSGDPVPIDQIRGVFVRLMDLQALPDLARRGRWNAVRPSMQRAVAFQGAFVEWLEIAACRVLNRPGRMASNMSKPYQALRIRRCGFRTPVTMITNDPDRVREFAAAHGRVIYKSISSIRSIVQELTDERMSELDFVRALPTQFQEYVPGIDIRVHTVGPHAFATEMRSEAVDYRYAASEGGTVTLTACDLPEAVVDRCLSLSAELELPLAGIDLRRTPDGVYYCFEVNPSPAYTYYEEHTGQPIAESIVRYLATGR